METVLWLLLAILVIAGILWALSRRGPNLAAEYRRQRLAEPGPDLSAPPLTEADIAMLPQPVQKYLRVTGNIGKPPAANVAVYFDAEMFSKPGAAAMAGPAVQYDRRDLPKRFFFMRTRMYGLPVVVLHDFDKDAASMVVRIASLFTAVDLKGEEASRTETVTILNDWCLYAPSWLTDKRLSWTAIDDSSAAVTFTNGRFSVSGTLYFNEAGELANFISDDRGALQDDGSLRRARWSTPVGGYREFEGRRVPSKGDAVWNYPEGDFTYGRFIARDVRYNVTGSD